jgi:hypothetical protein
MAFLRRPVEDALATLTNHFGQLGIAQLHPRKIFVVEVGHVPPNCHAGHAGRISNDKVTN